MAHPAAARVREAARRVDAAVELEHELDVHGRPDHARAAALFRRRLAAHGHCVGGDGAPGIPYVEDGFLVVGIWASSPTGGRSVGSEKERGVRASWLRGVLGRGLGGLGLFSTLFAKGGSE